MFSAASSQAEQPPPFQAQVLEAARESNVAPTPEGQEESKA